jgi:Ca2+-binding RTX toxin-like protein
MNINSNDSNSSLTTTNTNSAGGIATATVNVAATAATALTFTGTTTKIINGASSTGALTIDAAAAFADSTTKVGVSITTGSGKDTISALTAQNDTVNTGAGNDTISDLAAGDDTINLGDGDDTLSIAAANFANLTSADKIDGGLGVDSLSVTAANGGTYSFKGANAANLSGVTGIERFELNVTALTGTQTAAMQFDDATMSVAGNALTLVAKPNSTAVAGVVAVLDTSAVVLSSGTVTLDASTFGSILGYVGGNAKETITGGTQADVFTYSTSAYLAGTDVIKGGTGADVLVLSEVAAKTITAAQLVGVSSVGTINLDGVDGNNTAAIKITLSAAVATAMAESDALTVRSINASAAVDDTGKITVDGSTVGSDVALTLTGALGIDTLSGGAGADQISGGAAKDVLTGNGGKDTFNFVATATATTDTIKDFDAGTSTTTVDTFKVTLAAATWATGATIITASSGAAANDSRVVLLDTASYANLAAAEDAAAALHTADGNADYLFIWQDSLGNVHVSYDGDQATDAAGTEAAGTTGLLDLAILQGVTITGLAANLNYADFTFA